MKTLLSLIPLMLISCEMPSEYYARSATGNVVYEKRGGMLGGTRSSHRSDGSGEVVDLQVSYRDTTDMVQTAALAAAGVANVKSDNALKESQSAQETARAANARPPTIVPPTFGPHGAAYFPKVNPPPKAVVP